MVAAAGTLTVGTTPFFATWEGPLPLVQNRSRHLGRAAAVSTEHGGVLHPRPDRRSWERGTRRPRGPRVGGGRSAAARGFEVVWIPPAWVAQPRGRGSVSSNNRSVACSQIFGLFQTG